MPMTVRLSPEIDADLKEIADDEQIPPAILARNWITSEIKRRKTPKRRETDDKGDTTDRA